MSIFKTYVNYTKSFGMNQLCKVKDYCMKYFVENLQYTTNEQWVISTYFFFFLFTKMNYCLSIPQKPLIYITYSIMKNLWNYNGTYTQLYNKNIYLYNIASKEYM